MNIEQFEALGRRRVIRGDLFEHPNIVVPIKTAGQWYSSISRAVSAIVEFPHLSLCGSKVVSHGGKNYVFVALWDDHTPYSNRHIGNCMSSTLLATARAKLETLGTPRRGRSTSGRWSRPSGWLCPTLSS